MNRPVRVLMICTGNICRSPTAEGVLRHMAWDAGQAKRIEVDSAGTTAYHVGEPPDPRSVRHARRRGYDLSGLRARRVTDDDFERFDWLIAMDHDHVADLKRDCPPHLLARIRLLMDFAENPVGRDVPDPYYGNAADFENVLDRVEVGCRGLLAALLEAPARPAQATPESSSDT